MKTKPFIITILAAIGIIGGTVAMIGDDFPEESGEAGYIEHTGPVEYMDFTEPMEIKGYVQHIDFTDEEANEIWVDVN
jgi:hypothetical protein